MSKQTKKPIRQLADKKKFVPHSAPAKKKVVVKAAVAKSGKVAHAPTLLRGMKDILPRDNWAWKKMLTEAESIAESYGYGRLETPILEEATLFMRSIGKGTDVVDKEMYVFEDKDGSKVALRPEMTASVARAFIDHGMAAWPKPIKLWYFGSMFRHDRPQSGRFREFHQFGCEALGTRESVVDAELIVVAYNFLRDLGIPSQIRINSIGNSEDRARYTSELMSYLRSKKLYLCEDCRLRMTKNPLRVLDCKNHQCQSTIDDAPQIIDWLGEESKKFFMSVLEYLDEMGMPYTLDSKLVRGLDYYSDTVFEIVEDTSGDPVKVVTGEVKEGNEEGRALTIIGGGRYDGLVGLLGGQPTPAAGFAVGLERVASIIRRREQDSGVAVSGEKAKIFFAHLGEQSCRKALFLIEELRRTGILVRHNLGKPALKSQLELADKLGATHTLILGQKEMLDGTVIVRDMESGIQEIIDQKKIGQYVRRLLDKK